MKVFNSYKLIYKTFFKVAIGKIYHAPP